MLMTLNVRMDQSGSIDEDAIHYLMTRGIELSMAKKF